MIAARTSVKRNQRRPWLCEVLQRTGELQDRADSATLVTVPIILCEIVNYLRNYELRTNDRRKTESRRHCQQLSEQTAVPVKTCALRQFRRSQHRTGIWIRELLRT
uniref:(northern house mosquito) hypothetical protein n=1 Tax=Culex pipiens TaxID=7175 RepID=A0A8D8AYJ8_CULPI